MCSIRIAMLESRRIASLFNCWASHNAFSPTYSVASQRNHAPPSEPPSNAGVTGAFGEDCLSPRRFFRAGEFRSRLSLRVTQDIPEGRFSGAAFFGLPFLAAQERVVAAGLPPANPGL